MGATLVVNGEAVQVPPIGFPGIDGDRRPIDLSGYFFSSFLVSVQIGFVRVRGRGAVLQDEPAGRDRCGCHRELCRRPGSRGRLGEGHWHGLDGSLLGGMVRVRRRGCVFLRFHVTFCLTGTFAAD